MGNQQLIRCKEALERLELLAKVLPQAHIRSHPVMETREVFGDNQADALNQILRFYLRDDLRNLKGFIESYDK